MKIYSNWLLNSARLLNTFILVKILNWETAEKKQTDM